MNKRGLTTALDPEMKLFWNHTIICGVLGADNIHLLGDMNLRNFNGLPTFQTCFGNIPFGLRRDVAEPGTPVSAFVVASVVSLLST